MARIRSKTTKEGLKKNAVYIQKNLYKIYKKFCDTVHIPEMSLKDLMMQEEPILTQLVDGSWAASGGETITVNQINVPEFSDFYSPILITTKKAISRRVTHPEMGLGIFPYFSSALEGNLDIDSLNMQVSTIAECGEHGKNEKRHPKSGSKVVAECFMIITMGFAKINSKNLGEVGQSIQGTRSTDFLIARRSLNTLNRFFRRSGLYFLKFDLKGILNIYQYALVPIFSYLNFVMLEVPNTNPDKRNSKSKRVHFDLPTQNNDTQSPGKIVKKNKTNSALPNNANRAAENLNVPRNKNGSRQISKKSPRVHFEIPEQNNDKPNLKRPPGRDRTTPHSQIKANRGTKNFITAHKKSHPQQKIININDPKLVQRQKNFRSRLHEKIYLKNSNHGTQANVDIFKDTRKIIDKMSAPEENSAIYTLEDSGLLYPGDVTLKSSRDPSIQKKGRILVVPESCLGGIWKAMRDNNISGGKVAVHNFANPTVPGGGAPHGCRPQEETIMRSTNAFSHLNNRNNLENYYAVNDYIEKDPNSNENDSNRLIYTSEVIQIKEDYGKYKSLKRRKKIDTITVAAPKLAGGQKPDDILISQMTNMIRLVLEAAKVHDVDILGTGAFGCGIHGWPADIVEGIFYNLLIQQGYRYYFNYTIFTMNSTGYTYNLFKTLEQQS